jgi:hypothetical protein
LYGASVIVMDDGGERAGAGVVAEGIGRVVCVSVSGGGSTGSAARAAPEVARASADATQAKRRHRWIRLK